MATSTSSRSSVHARRRPTTRGWLLRALAVVAVALLGVAALFIGLRIARPGVLPRTQVAGVQVGGMDRATLERTLTDLARRRAADQVTATRGDAAVRATNAELGYRLDVDATVAAAWERGRQPNLITALTDHLRAFNGPTVVDPREVVAAQPFEAWIDEAARRLRRRVRQPSVTFDGAEVVRTPARPGARVVVEPLRVDVRAALLEPGDETVAVETERILPRSDTEAIDAFVAEARRAVSAPVRLTRDGGAILLSPEELGSILSIEGDGRDGFRLTVSHQALAAHVTDDEVAAVQSEPADAEIAVTGGDVQITPSQPGFRFVPQVAAEQVAALVGQRAGSAGAREATLEGETVRPDRTTEDARELGITEVVSSFTTEHACCESRVANIQRFADIVDGALIEPGETFSLNDHVGERTTEKGFVGGGAIYNGEYVEQVGGGVSQFATTFFNAAYFGGYDILQHKPHSYYISRYPVGRESTINYPNVDVEILNDSPYGLLVKTSYTDTSITVTFWGTEWVDVDSVTGEPHNFTEPETIYQETDEIPVGEERVVQAGGGQGFDIVVTRILEFPDGRTEREEFFTRYYAEARIIERNTG